MKYFEQKISGGFINFVIARALMAVAAGFLGLFVPIFLFELFNNDFRFVAIYFTLISCIYLLLLPHFKRISAIGFKRALSVSVFFIIAYYIVLTFVTTDTILIFIPLAIILLAIFRFLFWLPFHTDFTKLSDGADRGKQFSLLQAVRFGVQIVGPIVAGFVIAQLGYNALFIFAIALYILTAWQFNRIDCIYEDFTWTANETWNRFFRHIKDGALIPYVAVGIESFAALYVWPVFIFMLLKGNLLDVGIIASLITVVVIFLQLITGKVLDKNKNNTKVLKVGSFLYSIGWIIKIFVVTAFDIFIAGLFHRFTKVFTETPFSVLMYEDASEQGHLVDEYTAIREMAIQAGRIIMGIIIFLVLFVTSLQMIFIIAAVATLLFNAFAHEHLDLRREKFM